MTGSAVTGEVSLDVLSAFVTDVHDSFDDVIDGIERSGLVSVKQGRLQWRRAWMSVAVARRCDADRRERLAAALHHRRVGAVVDQTSHEIASPGLTASERRVVDVIIGGASVRETADQLYISARTVGSHLQSAYRKLGIHSRAQLAALMLSGDQVAALPIAV